MKTIARGTKTTTSDGEVLPCRSCVVYLHLFVPFLLDARYIIHRQLVTTERNKSEHTKFIVEEQEERVSINH